MEKYISVTVLFKLPERCEDWEARKELITNLARKHLGVYRTNMCLVKGGWICDFTAPEEKLYAFLKEFEEYCTDGGEILECNYC